MSENNDDQIDLKPYIRLFKKVLKSLENWIYKRSLLIIISFSLIASIYYILDILSEPKYKISTTIGKNFVSSEQLKSLLQSIKVNVKTNNTPEYFNSFENKLNDEFKIFDINYVFPMTLKDSLIIEKENLSIDNFENDGDVKIELITNCDTSLMSKLFVDFLNNHPYIAELKKSQINLYNETYFNLQREISEIDTVINHLVFNNNELVSKKRDEGSIITLNENNNTIYHLFNYRNKLIREKAEISNKLEFMNSNAIYIIGDFNRAKKIEFFSIFELKTFIKLLLLSVLIVIIFPFFSRKKKLNK